MRRVRCVCGATADIVCINNHDRYTMHGERVAGLMKLQLSDIQLPMGADVWLDYTTPPRV